MSSKRSPPPYPEKLSIAVFGKRVQLKNTIGNMILNMDSHFKSTENVLVAGESNTYIVINTPDFFDEDCQKQDQQMIDFMAVSHPGLHLFLLAIDSENTTEEKIVAQITKLLDLFGERIKAHLVVMLPDIESFQSLSRLKERFQIMLVMANENLVSECRKWCQRRRPFLFDYKDYSEDVVIRRQKHFERITNEASPTYETVMMGTSPAGPSTSQHTTNAGAAQRHHKEKHNNAKTFRIFHVILLGLTGTGKSASANTMLAAGKSEVEQFRSEASSVPVTIRCEFRDISKPFGMHVRLIDTPDFFHEELKNPEAHLAECKQYCVPGQCVFLLVIQVGRFTNGEQGILERLEEQIGWNIRDSMILLFTHGDDLKGSQVAPYIRSNPALQHIIDMCSSRYHVFNNKSKDPKQVIELIKKIPNSATLFPKFTKKYSEDMDPPCSLL
ncbi:hypothetical protein JOB18_021100 [Solea senegalensis]|uniref:GTPase IMAP family member 8-like n=1 Tax=Solea senegalensis TaxID=28829 RepID=A0AAV6R0I2_SOLSE|nr:GTPase IMAP family member 8-like isoform X2 [Solea senegalensis]KAG7498801.1 GTPase IMAP family member 8-like [Solea senegalensis]KAG7498802.1 hypothetical protein JOB18_021100 [Solea senegalensis]